MLQAIRSCRAIGVVIAIITLKLLVPDVWHAIEVTLLQFFATLQKTLALAPGDILQGNVISVPQMPY
jgi:hypothetical protein